MAKTTPAVLLDPALVRQANCVTNFQMNSICSFQAFNAAFDTRWARIFHKGDFLLCNMFPYLAIYRKSTPCIVSKKSWTTKVYKCKSMMCVLYMTLAKAHLETKQCRTVKSRLCLYPFLLLPKARC